MRIVLLLLAFGLLTAPLAAAQPVVGFAPGSPLPDTAPGDLANLDSQTKALSVTPATSGVTSVSSASVSTVIAAGVKNFWSIANNNVAGGSDLVCTDDGSTPSATHWRIRVYAAGFYEAMRPGFVSALAVQCIGYSATVPILGESF
jgi:hypothetical protein